MVPARRARLREDSPPPRERYRRALRAGALRLPARSRARYGHRRRNSAPKNAEERRTEERAAAMPRPGGEAARREAAATAGVAGASS